MDPYIDVSDDDWERGCATLRCFPWVSDPPAGSMPNKIKNSIFAGHVISLAYPHAHYKSYMVDDDGYFILDFLNLLESRINYRPSPKR